jgi:hypothetical protein
MVPGSVASKLSYSQITRIVLPWKLPARQVYQLRRSLQRTTSELLHKI